MDRGDVGGALRIVEGGIDLNTPCDDGASPLFLAVLLGDLELRRSMLDRGAHLDLEAADPAASCYVETPLLLARQARGVMDHEKYTPVVELLEEFGARTK